MPLARIRTLDPEVIAFLAPKLAAAGYRLQFVKPGEVCAEEADLEIAATRMDVETALSQAKVQAEEMGVGITVMPGAIERVTYANVPSAEVGEEPEFAAAELHPLSAANAVHEEIVESEMVEQEVVARQPEPFPEPGPLPEPEPMPDPAPLPDPVPLPEIRTSEEEEPVVVSEAEESPSYVDYEPTIADESYAEAPSQSEAYHEREWSEPVHQASHEFMNAEVSPYARGAEVEQPPSKLQEAAQSTQEALSRALGAIDAIGESSLHKVRNWRQRRAEERDRRREEEEHQAAVTMSQKQRREEAVRDHQARRAQELQEYQPPLPADPFREPIGSRPRLAAVPSSSMKSTRTRDRNYRRAAVAAAIVVAAGMLVWGIAGRGGPANPLGKSAVNAQQQVPFGAASVSAPVQSATAPAKSIAPPKRTARATGHSLKNKPNAYHKTRAKRSAAGHPHTYAQTQPTKDFGPEVTVRHFGGKPIDQQAKAKTKDGVKIITEE